MMKGGREVVREFTKVGLEVEVVSKSKHYFIYHQSRMVYKFSQGSSTPSYAVRAVRKVVKRCLETETELKVRPKCQP